MIAKRDHNFFWGSFRFRIFFLLMIMGLLPLLAGSEMIKRSYRSSIIDQKLSELRLYMSDCSRTNERKFSGGSSR